MFLKSLYETRLYIVVFLSCILLFSGAVAYAGGGVEYIGPGGIELVGGSEETVEFNFLVAEDWYINSNPPAADFLIPAALESASEKLKLLQVDYPDGEKYKSEFSEEKLTVYNDTFSIKAKLRPGQKLSAGNHPVPFILRYQACQKAVCRPPTEIKFTISADIKKASKPGNSNGPEGLNRLFLYTAVLAGLFLIAGSLKLFWKIIKKL
jgi:hypothetical protein